MIVLTVMACTVALSTLAAGTYHHRARQATKDGREHLAANYTYERNGWLTITALTITTTTVTAAALILDALTTGAS